MSSTHSVAAPRFSMSTTESSDAIRTSILSQYSPNHSRSSLAMPGTAELEQVFPTRFNSSSSSLPSYLHFPPPLSSNLLPHPSSMSQGPPPWDDDPRNPRNWSTLTKWAMTGIVAFYTFVTPLASSMMAPGLPNIAIHYHITNSTVLALTLSIFLLAFAVGPLVIGPLSEIYGRAWVLHISNFFFLIFTLACAFAPNTGSLIAFRFLAGLGGGAPVSIGGACIGDLFAPAERATAMSIYTLGPLLGPVVGPIAGGFVSETIGFRYIFIILAALSGVSAAIGLPFLRETYAPVIQARIAQRERNISAEDAAEKAVLPSPSDLARSNTNVGSSSMVGTTVAEDGEPVKKFESYPGSVGNVKSDEEAQVQTPSSDQTQYPHQQQQQHQPYVGIAASQKPSMKEVLLNNLTRPVMILTRSFIGLMMSLFMALLYGFLYLLFTTFPDLFARNYGWGPGVSGLAYLGPGVGLLSSTSLGAWLMTKIYVKLTERNGGVSKPEFRVPSMAIGTVLVPVGLLWYGWSAQQRLHWLMPIIGSGVFAFGLMWIYIPIQLYMVDSFQYAASALAAAAVCRCLFAFIFPLFGEDMFNNLGIGWGNTLLAGLAIIIGVPFPIWVYYRGEEMRARNKLTR